MNVLILGSGGREHAIAWKLRSAPKLRKLYCAPGNVGIAGLAELVSIKLDDIAGLVSFAKEKQIDLTIVGPEYPLTLGVVDAFRAAGLAIFGPAQAAARLEGSKNFAKEVMNAAKVPNAAYRLCTSRAELLNYLKTAPIPTVLKADGLASGKGVFVCHTREEALAAVEPLFGEMKSDQVVVEEFMSGVEASFIVATDGKRVVPLAPSHDYKRIFDNDAGPNTGGMGTVSPTPRLSSEQGAWTVEHVIKPVLAEMERRGTPFSGFLYAGLMIDPSGSIRVVEFNARLGDPETQVIMRRLDSDLLELLHALATGTGSIETAWSNQCAVCVVLAAEGYPAKPRNGDEIVGINLAENLPGVVVFHAGTSGDARRVLTAGGRVLCVTGTGNSVHDARSCAYKGADMIQFKGRQLRRDIGLR